MSSTSLLDDVQGSSLRPRQLTNRLGYIVSLERPFHRFALLDANVNAKRLTLRQ